MKRRANHVRGKCSSRDLGPKALDQSVCSIFQTAISFEPFNCFCNPLCIKTESRHMLISCKRCNIVNDFQWRFGAAFQCSSFFICSADSCLVFKLTPDKTSEIFCSVFYTSNINYHHLYNINYFNIQLKINVLVIIKLVIRSAIQQMYFLATT